MHALLHDGIVEVFQVRLTRGVRHNAVSDSGRSKSTAHCPRRNVTRRTKLCSVRYKVLYLAGGGRLFLVPVSHCIGREKDPVYSRRHSSAAAAAITRFPVPADQKSSCALPRRECDPPHKTLFR